MQITKIISLLLIQMLLSVVVVNTYDASMTRTVSHESESMMGSVSTADGLEEGMNAPFVTTRENGPFPANGPFPLDGSRPTCTIAFNESTPYLTSGTIRIFANFTTNGSGIDPASVKINITVSGTSYIENSSMNSTNNTMWYYDWTVPGYDGPVNISIFAADNASNLLNPYPTNDTSRFIDNTAPSCIIAYNQSATYLIQGTQLRIFVNFTYISAGINSSSVKINISAGGTQLVFDDPLMQTNETLWYYDWVIPTGHDGAISVTVFAMDNGRQTLEQPDASKSIDNTLPSCTIAYNSSATYLSAGTPLKIYANFTENGSGIDPATVIINITTTGATSNHSMQTSNNTHWYYNWTIPAGNNGPVTIKVYAKDNVSHLLTQYPTPDTTKIIDNTPPNCTIAYNRSATYFKTGDALKVFANFTETSSGILASSVKIQIDTAGNGDLTNTTMTATDSTHYYYSWTVPDGADDDGVLTVKVYARDTAGNALTPYPTPSATKSIDNTAPSSSVDTITGYWKTTAITLTGTASDNLSGVKSVTLKYSYRASNATSWGGWITFGIDTASPWSWNFIFSNGSGHYRFYSIAIDNVTNTEPAPVSNDTYCGYDSVAPLSNVDVITEYWSASGPLSLTATVSDAISGVRNVTLNYRFRSTNASGWGDWISFGVDTSAPWSWSFTFSNGSGHYQFASIATDNATNQESLVGSDTACGYDIAAPSSVVLSISGYWKSSTTTLTAIASDLLSGIKNVTLRYSYRPSNLTGWGNWITYGVDTASPWSWNFTFSNGSGHYRFYSIATDNATNAESAPADNDTYCGFDIDPPSSNVDTITSYWKTGTTTLTATASDALSGMKNVTLTYSYRASNATSWGGWVTFGIDTASPWSWNFIFSNGSGHYRFYSIATDNATNAESAPTDNDTSCGYDPTPPASIIDSVNGYWQNTAPLLLTATANDTTSGVKDVSVYYYNSTDNNTWYGPLLFGTDTTSPWSWTFTFPDGNCSYRFYSIASDNAGNIENPPITNDTQCYYNNTPPVTPNHPGPANGTTFDVGSKPSAVNWTAGDTNNDVVNYTLYFKAGNSVFTTPYSTGTTTTRTVTTTWSTTYYWKINATDEHGAVTTGPIWHFTTDSESTPGGGGPGGGETGNNPPYANAGGPYLSSENMPITLDASKSRENDTDDKITGYRWDFTSDGTWDTPWATQPTISHNYLKGKYTVTVQVKDNHSGTSSATASVSIINSRINLSTEITHDLETTFGVTLSQSLYASDANGDGLVDTFNDPNHVLTAVHLAHIAGHIVFLLARTNESAPQVFWDITTNSLTPLMFTTGSTTTSIDTSQQTITVSVSVEKTQWIYLDIVDVYPPEMYPTFTLVVQTGNRTISSDRVWRENGRLHVLDDAATMYDFIYSYDMLPPEVTPASGATLTTGQPTFTIIFKEPVTITYATLNNDPIKGQFRTSDNMMFTFTPSAPLASGEYRLFVTGRDRDNNTRTLTASYTVVVVPTAVVEFPWMYVGIALVVIAVLILLFVVLRRNYYI
jgi:hypothetical protein